MYSEKILKIFEKLKIEEGDLIKVNDIEGILMPNTEFSNPNVIILKLKNGYNIGIEFNDQTKIELIEKRKKKEIEEKKEDIIVKNENLPLITILGAGGTIASKIEYETGAVYPSISAKELAIQFPEILEIANIKVKQVFNIFSEDMQAEHWIELAKECAKEIENKTYGIVILHGTDTMHYTSAALSFMLQNLPIPIILVGAQRSSDRPSSDNKVNLICSLIAAKSDFAEVSVCMHGSISDEFCYLFRGTKVRKMHTSRRDAFKAINSKPIAKIDYFKREIKFLDSVKKRENRKLILDTKIEKRVGIIYFHPNISEDFIRDLKNYYKGIVIAATGLGHVSNRIINALKELIDAGIPIVFAPQTIYGRLNLNVYSTGRKLLKIGVIGNLCDWTIETAYVKLCWVLGHTNDLEKVREMMYTNYANEISERLEE